MNKIIIFIGFIFTASLIYSQNTYLSFIDKSKSSETYPVRKFKDNGLKGMEITYNFPGAFVSNKTVKGIDYKYLQIKGFSKLQEVGKPALPTHNDIIAIPQGAKASIKIVEAKTKVYNNYLIHPALKPAPDTDEAPEPIFEIDEQFYKSDFNYPQKPVDIVEIQKIRGTDIALVRICPVQYNPAKQKLTVYSYIKYKIVFSNASAFIDKNSHSESFLRMLPNYFLNGNSIKNEVESYLNYKNNKKGGVLPSDAKNYIIFTHSDYLEAADSLAQWKRQLGYSVEVVSKPFWTSTQVKNEIHTRYHNWSPKPDYFTIIGDHQDVPGELIDGYYASDLYYVCMDGPTDYVSDMARGRISVSTPSEANAVVRKIINYERHPVTDPNFYSTGLICTYYQDKDSNSYADRRFAQTSEEIRNHMVNQLSLTVNRVYYADSARTPIYWNNSSYSAGEPLPNYLLKPAFPWDDDYNDIINYIDAGAFFVLHRDHGNIDKWGDPYFDVTHINSLNNGNKLPVVFSINCLTGRFIEPVSFAEKFLRMNNAGAVGVFAMAEVSYSGFNDALAFGLIDAIWSTPGIIPNFTGYGGITNPTIIPHGDIFTMGNVMNQGLIRMTETWGSSQTTYQLFHYFGDPAMKIWTKNPTIITANHIDSIICNDTSFTISSSSCLDGIATLVIDDELIGKTQLANGTGTITFPPVSGNTAILTISKHNHKPYIAYITITGDCPRAKFIINDSKFCIEDSIIFTDASSGNITSYSWNFGTDAVPASGNTIGTYVVNYLTHGNKTITLTVAGPNGSDSCSMDISIDERCKYYMASNDTIIYSCSGKLFDNGGVGDYSTNTNVVVTIAPPGASSIKLLFSSFNFENHYDFLNIYDGTDTLSPIIGNFDGGGLPNGGIIISSGGQITLQQTTDPGVNESGFELNFDCNYPNTPPIADFNVSDTISCTGTVQFNDLSANFPDNWLWDFGDGDTSTTQNPSHTYLTNGTYSVKLIAGNNYGTDSIIKSNLITIDIPAPPTANPGARCDSGTVILTASGNGILNWYDSLTGGNLLDTGATFTTPFIDSTTTFYVEDSIPSPSMYVGKPNTSGNLSYTNDTLAHYLVFDCYLPVILASVKVYANSAGNRTIELRDSNNVLLQSKTVYIISGQNRITLNFDIPVDNDLRLVCQPVARLCRNKYSIPYPYYIPGIIKIFTAGTEADSLYDIRYYYFFYDWEIKQPSCVSSRTPATATVSDTLSPVADFSYTNNDPTIIFSNTSLYGESYYWDFGDGDTSALKDPTHTYLADSTYYVILIVSNNCGTDTILDTIQIKASGIDDNNGVYDLQLFPNPTDGLLHISLTTTKKQTIELSLTDMLGQTMLNEKLSDLKGIYSNSIDLSIRAKGLYFIRITTEHETTTRKIIVY